MNAWLRRRAGGLREAMDDAACDAARLDATYAQFAAVNGALSRWGRVWGEVLRPRLGGGGSLLDVGCGGGDVARTLARLARRDGVRLQVTAIDPDPRAIRFARAAPPVPGVRFACADAAGLLAQGRRFDAVVSNHLLHHLSDEELPALLRASLGLARRVVVHNDIRRSDLAWLAFAAFALPFRGSFVREDGLRSVRRSFTEAELAALAGREATWRVRRLEPFRLLLVAAP